MVTKLYFFFEQNMNGCPMKNGGSRFYYTVCARVVTSFFVPIMRSTTIWIGSITAAWGRRVAINSRYGAEYSMDKNHVFSTISIELHFW